MTLTPNQKSWCLLGTSLLLLVLWSQVLYRYTQENNDRPLQSPIAAGEDYIAIDAHIGEIDTVQGRMLLTLLFTPHGHFDAGGGRLASDVEIDINDVGGEPLNFAAGRRMFAHEISIAFDRGDAKNYPFDRHQADLQWLGLAKDESTNTTSVPLSLRISGYPHGYVMQLGNGADSDHGYQHHVLRLQRSWLVIAPALFCALIVWGFTLINLLLLRQALLRRYAVDTELFVYMSGLIVALYFFREVLPDIPPYFGTLIDYIAFFPAEILTMTVAVVFAILWYANLTREDT